MEKKIEKLEGSYDVPQLKQKLNEIIDYLNAKEKYDLFTKNELGFIFDCVYDTTTKPILEYKKLKSVIVGKLVKILEEKNNEDTKV